MKISRVLIVILSLFFVGGILFAAKPYDIQANIKNAVQHIQLLKLLDELNSDGSVKIKDEYTNLKIEDAASFNFLLAWNNTIESSSWSSILWWKENAILWLLGGTILWWKNNTGQSSYSIVNGGEKNQIDSNSTSSVIMWWVRNVVRSDSDSSVIAGWSNNKVKWRHSTVAWQNSEIIWTGSIALWSDITVKWDNSFFWSDGSTIRELSGDSVFVVMSEHWIVINTGVAHSGVQLTVGWSLVVSQQTWVNIKCESGFWAWIMVLTGKWGSIDQKCLCSCDGYAWHSLVGNGQCETICNGSTQAEPQCGTGLSVVKIWNSWTYLWTCEKWFPIDDSYRVISYVWTDAWWNVITWEKVQWMCQENNGNVVDVACEYVIACEWNIATGAHRNNSMVPSLDPSVNRNYKYSDDPSVLCSYSCNEWYVWTWGKCQEICNKSGKSCYIGVRNESDPEDWFGNKYYYNCNYIYGWHIHTQKCDMKCDVDKIWDGNSKSCKSRGDACGTSRYSCNFWIPSKTSMDEEDRVSKYFTWSCNDWYGTPIRDCSKAKATWDKNVYYNVTNVWNVKTVWFSIDWALSWWVNIKLPYTVNGWNFVDNYVIAANTGISQKRSYDSSLNNITLNTPYFGEDEIVQWEMVYKLKIVNGNTANNYCAESCSTMGQCLNGAVLGWGWWWGWWWGWFPIPNSEWYSLNKHWAETTYTWKCTKWWTTQNCSVSCRINASSCSSVPTWAISCDASVDSECIPLWSWYNWSSTNFYMYDTEEVISNSSCWTKRHCRFTGNYSYVTCTKETHYCTEPWFKCSDDKVPWIKSCGCVNVCTSSNGVWGCNGGATVNLPWATWTTGYNYTCTLRSKTYNCSATCPSGKYWNGSACVNASSLCWTMHYNCTNGAKMTANTYSSSSHKYEWKCTLWGIWSTCRECESGYTLSGSVCVATSINCEKNDNLSGYKIPALNHGGSLTVTRTDSTQKCTSTATCMNGKITLWAESCALACNKATNPWTCNLDLSATNYTWTKWWYSYTYRCGDFACGVICDSGKIWDGNACVDKLQPLPLCGSTANTCVQWTPQNKTSNELGDTWNCLDAQNKKINVSWVCYKCKSGYMWNGSKCAKSCKTADNATWEDGKVWDAYIGTGRACPSSCASAKTSVKCDDGDFVYNTYPYKIVTIPVYNDCITEGVAWCGNSCDAWYIWSGGNCVLLSNCNVVSHASQTPNVNTPYYVSDSSCSDQYCVYQMIIDERNHWSDWWVWRYDARVWTVYVAPYSSETITTRYDAMEYCYSLNLLWLNWELPHAYLAFYPQMTNKGSDLYQLTAQWSEKGNHYWASNWLPTTDTNCLYYGSCWTETSNQKLSVRCIAWVDYNICN